MSEEMKLSDEQIDRFDATGARPDGMTLSDLLGILCAQAKLANAPAHADEPVAWLVDRGQSENHSPTIWLKSFAARQQFESYEATWTTTAAEAERYETKEAAQSVADGVGLCRATEHIFMSAHPSAGIRSEVIEPTQEMIDAAMVESGMGYEWSKRVCKAIISAYVRALGESS